MWDNLGSDDDYTGDDYVGDEEVLGAVARGRGGVALAPRQQQRRLQGPQLNAQARPPIKLRGYLGLGSVLFSSTTLTTQAMIVEPQRAFRAERMVLIRRDGSASGTAGLSTTVDSVFIGDQPQSPSVSQGAPTEMFSADATVSGVDFNKCVPGQQIRVQVSISAAPTGTEFVRIVGGLYGDMVR